MSIFNLFLISLGVSMDAFTIAVSNGVTNKNTTLKYSLKVALFFGLAQGLMPIIGYSFGICVNVFIQKYAKIISFAILLVLGVKTILNSKNNLSEKTNSTTSLFLESIATSIDALIIGVSIVAVNVNVLMMSMSMFLVTFIVCFLGVLLGKKFNTIFCENAEKIGGCILVFIAFSMLK